MVNLLVNSSLENHLLRFLQKHIVFKQNQKIFRQGILLLFKQDHFQLNLTLRNTFNEKDQFSLDLPFPPKWEYYQEDSVLYLDYRNYTYLKTPESRKRLDNLIKTHNNLLHINSRYYDTIIELKLNHV